MSEPRDNRGAYEMRARRAARRLSQEELGKLVGMDQGDVSRTESGHRLPNLRQAIEIERALGIKQRWWFAAAPVASAADSATGLTGNDDGGEQVA